MRLVPEVSWRGREPLDSRLLPLLKAIRVRRTLRAAADEVGISYRAAWGLLATQTASLGSSLVVMQRGRGTALSPLGERLVVADETVRRSLARLEPQVAVPIADGTARRRIQIAASHDPLLVALSETTTVPLEISFKGSLDSLQALARNEVEIAGFHATVGADAAADAATLLRLLHPRRHRLVRFALRDQGLMVAKGNPRRIHDVTDLVGGRLTFVNRQRGSGTRLLLDRMLAQHGLSPRQLRGYATEEFTHLAVAATVASGRADAGLGIRAAARQFGLDFVPVRRERYWFALAVRSERDRAIAEFVDALRSPELQRLARRFPGYDARGAGETCGVDRLLTES